MSRHQRSTLIPIMLAAVTMLWAVDPPAHGQCELRWRRVFESRALPAAQTWAIAETGDGTLFAAEFFSAGPGLRMWRSDGAGWEQTGTSSAASFSRPLAFDAARDRIVAFQGGGAVGPADMGVWEWDGQAWSLREPPPGTPVPPIRTGFGAAYDAARGMTVLFGGRRNDSVHYNETWGWDGQRWHLLHPGGFGETPPARRSGHVMVYDEVRQVIVAHGGAYFTTRTDTWEWDGSAWSERSAVGPVVHDPLLATFNRASGRATLLSRIDPEAPLMLWEWDGAAWAAVAGSEVDPRSGAVLADDGHGRLLLLGGSSQTSYGQNALDMDLAWDGAAWRPVDDGPRPRRCRLAYDPERRVVVMVGGRGPTNLADVWEWNGEAWSHRPDSGLDNAWRARAVYFPPLGGVVAFGEAIGLLHTFSPTVLWDGAEWGIVPHPMVPSPGWRTAHDAVLDSHRGRIVTFGGIGEFAGGIYSDTWEFDGENWVRIALTGPSARYAHAMAYDPVDQQTLLFGGFAPTPNNETWAWDGQLQSWTLLATAGPLPLGHAGMIFDTHRGTALLFGGLRELGNPVNGLWEWDGSAWSFLPVAGPIPSPRAAAGFVYDPHRRLAVLHGGYTYRPSDPMHPYLGDTWLLHRAADHDIDGAIDSRDIAAFLERWARAVGDGSPDADFNLDGATTAADISAFLDAWLAAVNGGC